MKPQHFIGKYESMANDSTGKLQNGHPTKTSTKACSKTQEKFLKKEEYLEKEFIWC